MEIGRAGSELHRGVRWRGFGPERVVRKEACDELGVKCVSGFVRDDQRLQGPADQGEVADQVERLMAAEFVREAQRAVQNGAVVHDDGIRERAAANQAHLLQGRKFLHKCESSRGSQARG